MSMTATAVATGSAFRVDLTVANLHRSVAFYRVLLGTDPSALSEDSARFEVERPALVLTLHPGPVQLGGPLNHAGLRVPDSEMLVEMQKRLEEAGMATQSQEGVECCYARSTKFWVTDPDRTLWELYTLEADIDHSGFDDPPAVQPEAIPPGTMRQVVYKGPFARVTAEDGTVYCRGEKQSISAAQWELLRRGPGADAFALLP
jgi:catechol 2,3-dioxygenase-like lactoylglutathione lyase family enzyme